MQRRLQPPSLTALCGAILLVASCSEPRNTVETDDPGAPGAADAGQSTVVDARNGGSDPHDDGGVAGAGATGAGGGGGRGGTTAIADAAAPVDSGAPPASDGAMAGATEVLKISEFPQAHAGRGLTAGPDGNMWFTTGDGVGRLTPTGTVTTFTRSERSFTMGIIAGAADVLWYVEAGAGKINRITTAGVTTEFEVTKVAPGLTNLALGPDGNIWFTDSEANKIGRLSPATGDLVAFIVPTLNAYPQGIVAGPDGNLWFIEAKADQIGQITPEGTIREFRPPEREPALQSIVVGPDRNLWFTELKGQKVGRITPAGVITEFPLPPQIASPLSITLGPDGHLWFLVYTGAGLDMVGRITTSGVATAFVAPTVGTLPRLITSGPNQDLWFTSNNGVSRFKP